MEKEKQTNKIFVLVDEKDNSIAIIEGIGTYPIQFMPFFLTKEDAENAKEVLEETTDNKYGIEEVEIIIDVE